MLFGLLALGFFLALPESASAQVLAPESLQPLLDLKSQIERGETLSHQYCAACHLYPEPTLLDRRSWEQGALPWMRMFHGLDPERVDKSPEGKLLRATGRFPEEPILSETDWTAIAAYYVHNAPESPITNSNSKKIRPTLSRFEIRVPQFPSKIPMTTMAQWAPGQKQIALGDASLKSLIWMDALGNQKGTVRLGNIPVQILPAQNRKGYWVVGIGSFFPSEKKQGEVFWIEEKAPSEGESSWEIRKVLSGLPRPAHLLEVDLNADGRYDLVTSLFGNFQGRFSWWEQLENGEYEERVLFAMPGALKSESRDFDGDGDLDLMVLVAQETESLLIYWNEGQGQFREQVVYKKPSAFGHSFFELVDMNGDGREELLVTNGDNGDYQAGYKSYHGVRIYELPTDWSLSLKELWSFPLNGAYKALGRDFDLDGDVDIAAISFFPNYKDSPLESFVLLENQGSSNGWDYKPVTFDKSLAGRWLSMDAADMDSDGDLDIVLGSVVQGPSSVPPALARIRSKNQLGSVLLINKTK